MRFFEDLPTFAIEKIIQKTSFEDKTNLLTASSSNKTLKFRLSALCKVKRSKFCPFCILYVGTDYSEESGRKLIEDFHNQILNSKSGDMNWEWTITENFYSIKEILDEEDYCMGYFSHGGRWVSDIMFVLTQQNNYQRKLLLQQFNMLYNLESADVLSFDTNDALYNHIQCCHRNLFRGKESITDKQALKNLIWQEFESNVVFDLNKFYDNKSRQEIFQMIHWNIGCIFLVYTESLEKAFSIRMEIDSRQRYFDVQVELLF